MTTPVNANNAYTDLNSLNAIKQVGRTDSAAGLKQVAQQFEALFVNMMLKTMRDSNKVFSEGNPLQSSEMDFYQQNFDNQISLHLTQGKGLGLAEVLHKQLMQQYKAGSAEHKPNAQQVAKGKPEFSSPLEFVKGLLPAAREAASKIGVKAEVLLAQSALETGWGASIARDSEYRNSHNLFGVKADANWQGPVTRNQTVEFTGGVAKQQSAKFRHYESYQESFQDYVSFLKNNPRYAKALEVASSSEKYIHELHEAGYATDPDYGKKISDVLQSNAMRAALRETQLSGGGE